jgi:hypothetical protein
MDMLAMHNHTSNMGLKEYNYGRRFEIWSNISSPTCWSPISSSKHYFKSCITSMKVIVQYFVSDDIHDVMTNVDSFII